MLKTTTLLLFLLVHCFSYGQNSAQSYPTIPKAGLKYRDFIPSGWDTLATAKGDLNKDSIPDLAVIIERKPLKQAATDDEPAESQPRILLVLFQQKEGLKLACQANEAIITADGGGMMGDPFMGLSIRRGCIVADFFGGSSSKWNLSHTYRYQKGDFYLIGAENTEGNATYSIKRSYNLNTGRLEVEAAYEEEPKKNKKYQKVIKQTQLPLLKSFEPWSLSISDEITF